MSLLQILLSILSICFVLWMYGSVNTDRELIPKLSQLKKVWSVKFLYRLFSPIRYIFNKFNQFLFFLKKNVKNFFKFLVEITFEILFNLILRGIWIIIKSIFLAIFRIFD